MPRRKAPSYRLHAASGQAIVTINYKTIYLGKHGSKESHRRFEDVSRRWAAGEFAIKEQAAFAAVGTVGAAVAAYLAHLEKKLASKRQELSHFRRALAPLAESYKALPIEEFTPKKFRACLQVLAGRYVRRQVNRYLRRIRELFAWLVCEELIPAGILHALQAVTSLKVGEFGVREPKDVLPVTVAHLEATLPHLGRIPRAMVEVQLWTGMRPGELVQLRPADIARAGRVEIAPGFWLELGRCWLYKPSKHKTQYRRHSRLVLIGPRAQGILKPFLERDPSKPCFSPAEAFAEFMQAAGRKPNGLAKRKPGDQYLVSSYGHAIEKACARAGIQRWTAHQLRHSAASNIAAEFGPEIARIVLGHRTFAATRIYILEDLRKAVAAMEQAG